MKILNSKIYMIANQLAQIGQLDMYIPAKANFFIQKNIALIEQAVQSINSVRIEILEQYGQLKEDGSGYTIPQDNIDIVNQEFDDLLNIEQELNIKTFSIDALGETQFTAAQMQAIMFMIED